MEKGSPTRQKGGQILVLMALLSTTLVILFGMVVSIGHLVQAKINLQNAVDLAAMSGASWQARYLNHLALVNYRMRQNYKFILYDLYITQSRFNKGLTSQISFGANYGVGDKLPDTSQQISFGICQQAYGYTPQAPGEGGRGVDATTDFCRNIVGAGRTGQRIPPIIPSPVPNLNPILIAANIAIINLSREVERICTESGGQNKAYFTYIVNHLNDRQKFQLGEMLKILFQFDAAFGKGDDLERSGAAVADQTMVKTFEGNLIAANAGAQIQYLNPYKTRAFRNEGADANQLTTKIFDVNPPQGTFSEYFERQMVRFVTVFAEFKGGGGCSANIEQAESPSPTFLGLSRSRSTLSGGGLDPVKLPFNIVLKATAKPRLLFWPQGLTPTLVAVGAAKPFGSRIGPPSEMVNYETKGTKTRGEDNTQAFANMSYFPGDVKDGLTMPGIGHKAIIQALLRRLPLSGGSAGQNTNRPSIFQPEGDLQCATAGGSPPFICLSLAPTLYEGLFWNVYPFPAQKYSSGRPEIFSEFPFEVPLKAADQNAYLMLDRMRADRAPTPSELIKWHETVLIGKDAKFRDSSNKPVFFADGLSVASSWSPGYRSDLSDLNPSGGSLGSTPEGRTGYQIKLVGIRQLCKEIKDGGVVSNLGVMEQYCSDNDLGVFH